MSLDKALAFKRQDQHSGPLNLDTLEDMDNSEVTWDDFRQLEQDRLAERKLLKIKQQIEIAREQNDKERNEYLKLMRQVQNCINRAHVHLKDTAKRQEEAETRIQEAERRRMASEVQLQDLERRCEATVKLREAAEQKRVVTELKTADASLRKRFHEVRTLEAQRAAEESEKLVQEQVILIQNAEEDKLKVEKELKDLEKKCKNQVEKNKKGIQNKKDEERKQNAQGLKQVNKVKVKKGSK